MVRAYVAVVSMLSLILNRTIRVFEFCFSTERRRMQVRAARSGDPHVMLCLQQIDTNSRIVFDTANFADLLENRLSPIVQGLADIAEFTFLDGTVEVCEHHYDTYAVCVPVVRFFSFAVAS